MTASPRFSIPPADFPRLDDKMDLASSPYQQIDDIDLDLDQHPQMDNAMDDTSQGGEVRDETMDAGEEILFQDEEMVEEQHLFDEPESKTTELQMGDDERRGEQDKEDEILYDENEPEFDSEAQNQDLDYSDAEIYEEDLFEEEGPVVEALHTTQNASQGSEAPANSAIPAAEQSSLPIQRPVEESATESVNPNITEDANADSTIPNTSIDYNNDNDNDNEDTTAPPDEEEIGGNDLDHSLQTTITSPEAQLGQEELEETEPLEQTTTLLEEQESAIHEAGADQNLTDDPATDVKKLAEPQQQPLELVRVFYLDEELSLFPTPHAQDPHTYFLSDPFLAFSPLDQLLKACRDVLSTSIGHHDEVVLDIPPLGLHICEDSKYSSDITLSQILNIHIQLHRNQSETDPASPLYCHLSTRVCLRTQLNYIEESSKNNKTYSEIVDEHVESPYEDEADEEADATVDTGDYQGEEGPHDDDRQENQALIHEAGLFEDQVHQGADAGGLPENEEFQSQQEVADAPEEPADTDQDEANATLVESEQLQAPADDEVKQVTAEAFGLDQQITFTAEAQASDDAQVLETQHDTLYQDGEGEVYDFADTHDAEDELFGDEPEPAVAAEEFLEQEVVEDAEAEHQQDDQVYDAFDEFAGDGSVDQPNATGAADAESVNIEAKIVPGDSGEEPANGTASLAAGPVPETPSKPKGAKRKASEEDDELDLLEFDTPEPKRSRPS